MASMRTRRRKAQRSALLLWSDSFEAELREWNAMTPVGREFGSPDFDRLMEEDRRNSSGVFDPVLRRQVQRRIGRSKGAQLSGLALQNGGKQI